MEKTSHLLEGVREGCNLVPLVSIMWLVCAPVCRAFCLVIQCLHEMRVKSGPKKKHHGRSLKTRFCAKVIQSYFGFTCKVFFFF